VAPLGNGTFSFRFKPDAGVPPGNYAEHFTPVIDGRFWLQDVGLFWPIRHESRVRGRVH
jgi:hypothetical protein